MRTTSFNLCLFSKGGLDDGRNQLPLRKRHDKGTRQSTLIDILWKSTYLSSIQVERRHATNHWEKVRTARTTLRWALAVSVHLANCSRGFIWEGLLDLFVKGIELSEARVGFTLKRSLAVCMAHERTDTRLLYALEMLGTSTGNSYTPVARATLL